MKKIILFSLLLASSLAYGQGSQEELKDLVTKSFGYFPKIKEMEQQTVLSAERIELSRKNYMPTLAGNFSYNYVNPISQTSIPIGPGVTRELQFQPHNNFNANLALNYVVYDFGRTKASIEKSKEELKASQGALEANKTQLAAQVAGVYYGIIYLEKAIAIQDSVLATLEENKRVAESKLRHGEGLEIDLLNIKSTMDNERNRKADLENSLAKQYALLSYSTGSEAPITGMYFDFASENTSVGDALNKAVQDNYDFSVLKNRISVSKSDINLNRAQYMPTLNFVANTGYKNGYQPDLNQWRFNYLIGANLAVPIYSGGKIQQQVQIAKSTARLNELTMETLRNNYKRDIQQTLADINSNQERLRNIESQITQAKETTRLAASRFKNGTGTHLELTTAINNIQRAELTKLQYQYQLCLSNIELARLTGVKYW